MPLSHRAGIVLPGDQFLIALLYVDADNRVSGCVCRKILSIIDFASRFPPRHLLWPTWPSLLCHFASNASGYAASGACPGMSFCIERIVIRPISTQYQTTWQATNEFYNVIWLHSRLRQDVVSKRKRVVGGLYGSILYI